MQAIKTIYKTEPKWGIVIMEIIYDAYIEFEIYNFYQTDEKASFSEEDLPERVKEELIEENLFLKGSVKWDGCSNWDFKSQTFNSYHACDREGLLKVGDVMAFCWDITSKECPSWLED